MIRKMNGASQAKPNQGTYVHNKIITFISFAAPLNWRTFAARLKKSMEIRNIAIIAHVDHGKTTLVDKILHATKVFRDNQETGELIMDSNDLEWNVALLFLVRMRRLFIRM